MGKVVSGMAWVEVEGISYLDGAMTMIGKWGGGECWLAPAVGEGGPAWALLLISEGPTEVLALWYGPGDPDYVAIGDDEELAALIDVASDSINW